MYTKETETTNQPEEGAYENISNRSPNDVW